MALFSLPSSVPHNRCLKRGARWLGEAGIRSFWLEKMGLGFVGQGGGGWKAVAAVESGSLKGKQEAGEAGVRRFRPKIMGLGNVGKGGGGGGGGGVGDNRVPERKTEKDNCK